MNTRDQIAAHVRKTKGKNGRWSNEITQSVASAFESGFFDEVLGVSEPTLEDVKREACRVYTDGCAVAVIDGKVCVSMSRCTKEQGIYEVQCPTLAAAYAALRTMKNYDYEAMG